MACWELAEVFFLDHLDASLVLDNCADRRALDDLVKEEKSTHLASCHHDKHFVMKTTSKRNLYGNEYDNTKCLNVSIRCFTANHNFSCNQLSIFRGLEKVLNSHKDLMRNTFNRKT